MLRVFDIKYMPHTTIMGQVLADLVVEFTEVAEKDKMSGPEILIVSIPHP